jgi:hypothetical protein
MCRCGKGEFDRDYANSAIGTRSAIPAEDRAAQ